MKDTAEEIGSIDDCLYSLGNRVEAAKLLSSHGKTELLETALEDIFVGVQSMMDKYCMVRVNHI